MKKVIVIGTNHAGTASINTMLDNHADKVNVTTYDTNTNISFLGCGMALWIGKVIDRPDGLFYSNPDLLKSKGANVFMQHAVRDVNFETKEVTIEDLCTNEIKKDTYDELIISVGSWPVRPPIPGIDFDNIISVKLFQDAQKTIEKLNNDKLNDIVVVGAGYIGIELAEAFKVLGKNVTLIDMVDEVVPRYYDREFTRVMEENLTKNGVKLALGEQVKEFTGEDGKVTGVVTDKGTHKADLVMFSVGFRPNTKFLEGKGLDMLPNGAIKVDNKQESNIPGVYAIGDCATVYDNARQTQSYIALASNAVRTGIVAGSNVAGVEMEMNGVQGSNGIHIFGVTMLSTGLTEREAVAAGFDVAISTAEGKQKPDFIPSNDQIKVKIVYDKTTRRLLGAQMLANFDASLALHTFSLALQEKMTVDRLKLVDFFFLPHFNKPIDNIVAAVLGCK
jgi:NADPH-dependent 2,4-dienoyl-CoA reductase/sulfur reductase-like enzyme